ncbi:melanocortin-2 receptor accessory protein isoform X2 [Ahaetulla prasina]|uniref:melanocortin-2 receptor accessory protein isoform X2 n=1 Tax=Ahaetulla prasina TaxID=499056 RepID=UPI002648F755|nr:melanocortin-2 receptor accessory protein isoform X2 [Ahaetulla prasina]
MTNSTNYIERYEYYFDYLDLSPVDASKLKANRYSIVIGFWIGLVSFVALLFFILFYISRSGTTSMKLLCDELVTKILFLKRTPH